MEDREARYEFNALYDLQATYYHQPTQEADEVSVETTVAGNVSAVASHQMLHQNLCADGYNLAIDEVCIWNHICICQLSHIEVRTSLPTWPDAEALYRA